MLGLRCARAWHAKDLLNCRSVDYSETMFARRLSVQRIDAAGERHACPIRQIDNFAMRNFTNDAVFDDTFPAGDGVLEAGHRVPLDRLQDCDGRLVSAQRLPEARRTAGDHGDRLGPTLSRNAAARF